MSDRTVLITGCSSGIGRATAEAFAESEWVVYATARDTDDIVDLAEQGCETAQLDVTDDEDVAAVIERIDDHTGRVDCLVNNAGFGQYGPLEDVPVGRLHHQFGVNVYGPHRLARAVLPLMRLREDGTIVNVSSVYGRLAMPGTGPYSASKFALEAMSDSLRAEVDGFGIDVVVVEPGVVESDFPGRLQTELDGLSRSGAYDWLYDIIEDANVATGSMPFAIEPEEVATVVHDVACLSDPSPRYPVGSLAKVLVYSEFLPDRVRDGIYRTIRRVA